MSVRSNMPGRSPSPAPSPPESLVKQPAFARLKNHIIEATGLNYFADKDQDLAERVSRRLFQLGWQDCGRYLAFLEHSDGRREFDLLVPELTIGETYFFRHSEQFDALRDLIIPQIIARNRDSRSLQFWSAGCSNGSEPYTVAILLMTDFAAELADWNVTILATDINKDVLALAEAGSFDEWAFRGVPDELKRRCFSQSGKKWLLAPEYKTRVKFQHHNLITGDFPPSGNECQKFDVILCRNVVIYFNQDEFGKLVSRFESCLNDGGWLLVGHSEPNSEIFRGFSMISSPGAILYQRLSENHSPTVYQPRPKTTPDFSSLPVPEWSPYVVPKLSAHLVSTESVSTSALLDVSAAPMLDDLRKLADQGLWSQALSGCEILLAQDNLNSASHLFHAVALEHLGQQDDADQALRRALYLDRNSPLAHYHWGLRQRAKQDVMQAVRSFSTVEALLKSVADNQIIEDSDGMTAAELRQMAMLQSEALRG